MKTFSKLFFIVLVSFGILAGCNGNIEEAVSQSKKIAETTFNEEPEKATETTKGFSYYLPEGFKVKDEMENNVLLSKGKQEYILFVNPQESPDSKVLFNELKTVKEEEGIYSFEGDGRLGYISIAPAKEKKHELIVGIGGVKMTTLTSAGDMVENAKNMMIITNSVNYSKVKEQEQQTENVPEQEKEEENKK